MIDTQLSPARFVLALVAAATLIPALAGASTGNASTQQPSAVVRFGDLDLHRTADSRVLLNRIRAAAKDVCSDNYSPVARQRCYQNALAQAVSRINQPQFAAYARTQIAATL